MKPKVFVWGGLLALLAAASLAQAQGVARLLEVNGDVVIRPLAGEPRPAEVYGAVSAGEKLVLPANSSVVLGWHASGQLQRVSGAGEAQVGAQMVEAGAGVKVEPLSVPQQELVAKGVKALRDLPSGPSVTRGVKDKPVRPTIAPIFGSMVLTVEPTFSWPADKDATEYRVRLNDPSGQLWVNGPKQPRETKLPYPSNKPLERGLSYQWVVLAKKGNQGEQQVAEGEFTVAVEAEAREARELQTLAGQPNEFLLALVALRLEQQELFAEAIAVYEKLAKLSAKQPTYHAALSELYDRAGRRKEAAEARERAMKLGFKFN
jgi:hypothetical protein